MELIEDDNLQKYAKQYKGCFRNTLPPYENEWTSSSCGYNVSKQKMTLAKTNEKKN